MTSTPGTSRAARVALALTAYTVIVFVMLGLTELALRRFLPVPDPYGRIKESVGQGSYVPSAFRPHDTLHLEIEPDLPGMSGRARFTTNNVGYRGVRLQRPKPATELRIFMVGGSSTEGLYLDDTTVMSHLLERRLRAMPGAAGGARVYNAGKSGDKSFDHIAMLAHRIVHLEPDIVIVFAGINDVIAAIAGRDYLLFPERPTAGSSLWFRLAATEFQLPRHLQRVFTSGDAQSRMTAVSLVSDYASKVAVRKDGRPASTPPRTDLASYRENLATLVGITRAHGVRLVFMTQATTWGSEVDPALSDRFWMTHIGGVTYDDDALAVAMEAYNDVMREVARQHEVPVLELDRALPKSLRYFYDDVHFNRKGADTTAQLLAEFLQQQDLLRPAPSPAPPMRQQVEPLTAVSRGET